MALVLEDMASLSLLGSRIHSPPKVTLELSASYVMNVSGTYWSSTGKFNLINIEIKKGFKKDDLVL
jgi:hypothetical protein